MRLCTVAKVSGLDLRDGEQESVQQTCGDAGSERLPLRDKGATKLLTKTALCAKQKGVNRGSVLCLPVWEGGLKRGSSLCRGAS